MDFKLKKSNLNFRVYTVAAKPTTPGAENDIAIISSVPMTNWLMSPEAPSGIPRNDGDVWIQYSTKGDTKNILKQNAMMIATIKAWQYVDGAWVDREAVSYQGGKWVKWVVYLINGADLSESVTGGWTAYAKGYNASLNNGKQPELIKNNDSITLKLSEANYANGLFVTNKKINLQGIDKIYIDVVSISNGLDSDGGDICLSVYSSIGSYITSNQLANVDIAKADVAHELPVSTLNDEYYIAIALASGKSVTAEVTIESLRFG